MVLDIELFREEKGGDPKKIRQLQEKRFKSVKLVDEVVENDALWRQCKNVFIILFSGLLLRPVIGEKLYQFCAHLLHITSDLFLYFYVNDTSMLHS